MTPHREMNATAVTRRHKTSGVTHHANPALRTHSTAPGVRAIPREPSSSARHCKVGDMLQQASRYLSPMVCANCGSEDASQRQCQHCVVLFETTACTVDPNSNSLRSSWRIPKLTEWDRPQPLRPHRPPSDVCNSGVPHATSRPTDRTRECC
jgi:hypothetical protein